MAINGIGSDEPGAHFFSAPHFYGHQQPHCYVDQVRDMRGWHEAAHGNACCRGAWPVAAMHGPLMVLSGPNLNEACFVQPSALEQCIVIITMIVINNNQ